MKEWTECRRAHYALALSMIRKKCVYRFSEKICSNKRISAGIRFQRKVIPLWSAEDGIYAGRRATRTSEWELSYSRISRTIDLSLPCAGSPLWNLLRCRRRDPIADNVSFWFYGARLARLDRRAAAWNVAALYSGCAASRESAVRGLVASTAANRLLMWSNVCRALERQLESLSPKAKAFGSTIGPSHACDHAGNIMRKARSGLFALVFSSKSMSRAPKAMFCSGSRRLEALSTQGDRHRSGERPGVGAGMADWEQSLLLMATASSVRSRSTGFYVAKTS